MATDRLVAPASASDSRDERPPNPVVVIPGLLGSRLVVPGTSRSVWGDFEAGAADPRTVEGAELFAFPMELGKPLRELMPRSEVDGTLGHVRGTVAGVPVKVRVYGDILGGLGVGSFGGSFESEAGAADHAFEFAYDFRRSIDELACQLEDFLRRASRLVQLQRGNHDPVHFDVVAHSQGGLVLRYLLQYGGRLLPHDGLPRPTWAGAELVDTAVIVGTPSGGATVAYERLVSGVPGNPVHRTYGPELMGSFPSAWQLLPRARHGPVDSPFDLPADGLDPEFWLARDVGLVGSALAEARARMLPGLDSDAVRAEVAEDHLRKCLVNATAFQAAMDRPMPEKPAHLAMHLFLGEGQSTVSRVSVSPGASAVDVLDRAPGDGTVLATSAVLSDLAAGADTGTGADASSIPWDSVTRLRSGHVQLMSDRGLLTRLPELLRRAPGSGA